MLTVPGPSKGCKIVIGVPHEEILLLVQGGHRVEELYAR
jgi:hypothetical protein